MFVLNSDRFCPYSSKQHILRLECHVSHCFSWDRTFFCAGNFRFAFRQSIAYG
jgi:hypothetical protein